MVAGICLTGAFHEDGLGDTADAFAGGWDRDSTLRILKDPRLGTFGVLAVAASLLLRVGARWPPWPRRPPWPPCRPPTPSAGPAAVAAMTALPAAAETGLGASSTRSPCPAGGPWPGPPPAWPSPWPCSARPPSWAAAAAALAASLLGRLAPRRIGGVTGDVLGAVQQLGEILVLLAAAAAVTTGGWRSPVSSLLALVSGSA